MRWLALQFPFVIITNFKETPKLILSTMKRTGGGFPTRTLSHAPAGNLELACQLSKLILMDIYSLSNLLAGSDLDET
jgi:hypothetical protein